MLEELRLLISLFLASQITQVSFCQNWGKGLGKTKVMQTERKPYTWQLHIMFCPAASPQGRQLVPFISINWDAEHFSLLEILGKLGILSKTRDGKACQFWCHLLTLWLWSGSCLLFLCLFPHLCNEDNHVLVPTPAVVQRIESIRRGHPSDNGWHSALAVWYSIILFHRVAEKWDVFTVNPWQSTTWSPDCQTPEPKYNVSLWVRQGMRLLNAPKGRNQVPGGQKKRIDWDF